MNQEKFEPSEVKKHNFKPHKSYDDLFGTNKPCTSTHFELPHRPVKVISPKRNKEKR